MRPISSTVKAKLESRMNAGNTKLESSLWISRPNVPLSNSVFMERQKILGSGTSKASIAVSHPKMSRAADSLYIAYIQNGTAKIKMAKYHERLERQEWKDVQFSNPAATDISICFDGTMPKTSDNLIEFITEENPWVFWVQDTALYAQQLGSENIVTLAEANCIAVSATRAVWSSVGGFDFGLIVFFILGGYLYYRQLIKGVWYDAELVTFGPTGTMWTDVSAFRTWDYRIGVQLISQDGKTYEMFTQYMGIGKQTTEHIEIKSASRNSGKLTKIKRSTFNNEEHIAISDAENITPYQGIWTLGVPSLVDVYNIDDGSGNWGKTVVFAFDKELENESVQASIGSFYFVDSVEKYYFPSAITMDYTGRRAYLSFVDINNAVGQCVAYYEPGTVVTMMEEILAPQTVVFTPKNLIPGDSVLPEVVEMWNTNEIGTEVAIRFTRPIVDVPPESAEKFIVTIQEPIYVPGGKVSDSIKPVISVSGIAESGDANVIILHFEDGMFTSIRNAFGDITVQYIGSMVKGEEGPILGFKKKFTPEGLVMKPNPNDLEHIEIVKATSSGRLTAITYSDGKAPGEYLQLVGAKLTSTKLTHVNDL